MAIQSRTGQFFSEINITPLTDVFLVLLVVMLLIAPIANKTVLKLSEIGPSLDSKPQVSVYVDANGRMKVNQRTIGSDLSSIAAAIEAEQDKAGQQDLPVVVRPDPNVQQKYVVTVMDAAAQRNIKSLQVVCQ